MAQNRVKQRRKWEPEPLNQVIPWAAECVKIQQMLAENTQKVQHNRFSHAVHDCDVLSASTYVLGHPVEF